MTEELIGKTRELKEQPVKQQREMKWDPAEEKGRGREWVHYRKHVCMGSKDRDTAENTVRSLEDRTEKKSKAKWKQRIRRVRNWMSFMEEKGGQT